MPALARPRNVAARRVTDKAPFDNELSRLMVEVPDLELAQEGIGPEAPLFGEGPGRDSIDVREIALAIGQRFGVALRACLRGALRAPRASRPLQLVGFLRSAGHTVRRGGALSRTPMRRAARGWRWSALLTAGLAGAAAASGSFTIEALARELAAAPKSVLAFEETRYSSFLKQPLVTSGELRFTPPATLERRIVAPFAARYTIVDDRLTIEQPGAASPRTIPLASQPLLANLIGTIRALLGGDLASLGRLYRSELSGTREHWTLTLLPSDPAMVEFIASIEVRGRADALTEMEVTEPSGDRTVTRFARASEAAR